MPETRKYATACSVFRMLLKADGSGYIADPAWTAAAGDVIVSISTDGLSMASHANIATLPTWDSTHFSWKFAFSAAELTGKIIQVLIQDVTLSSDCFYIETCGHASAMYPDDFFTASTASLDAAGIRSAVGLASANLDTQLDALPTNAELATALGTADDAVLARLGAPAGASMSADIAAIKTDTGGVTSINTKLGTPAGASVSADIAAVKADTGTTLTNTGTINTKLGTPAGASVSVDIAAVKTDTGVLTNANQVETGVSLTGALRLFAAVLAGKASGLATATAVYRNAVADSKARVTATVDADGNRTAVTTDVT